MNPVFGAVADDLTGGLELAAMIVAAGVPCAFATEPPDRSEHPAIVIGRRTRVADPAVAVADIRRTGTWLREQGARQIFFKYCATFDSTPAGNIGNCADVLRELTASRLTAVCPSFPEAGRRVFQGHLFADDRLISESPKRYACLMANHGMVCTGASLAQAFARTVKLEMLARQYRLARQAGEIVHLTPGEMDVVLERYADYGRARLANS